MGPLSSKDFKVKLNLHPGLNVCLNRDLKLQRRRKGLIIFLVVLTCHYPVLDGFNEHFQATVHFSQSRAIDKPQQHQKIFL